MEAAFWRSRIGPVSIATDSATTIERAGAIRWFWCRSISTSATNAEWLATATTTTLSTRAKARHGDRVDDLRHLHSDDRMVLLPRRDFGAHSDRSGHLSTDSDQEQTGREYRQAFRDCGHRNR